MKIDAKRLSEELESGTVHLLDVRMPMEFRGMHIEGSELRPLHRLSPEGLEDKDCVVICRSGKRAEMAMEKLRGAGCRRVRVLEGGVLAWEQAGLPVVRGAAGLAPGMGFRIFAVLLLIAGLALGRWVDSGFYFLAFAGGWMAFASMTGCCCCAPGPGKGGDGGCGGGSSCAH